MINLELLKIWKGLLIFKMSGMKTREIILDQLAKVSEDKLQKIMQYINSLVEQSQDDSFEITSRDFKGKLDQADLRGEAYE